MAGLNPFLSNFIFLHLVTLTLSLSRITITITITMPVCAAAHLATPEPSSMNLAPASPQPAWPEPSQLLCQRPPARVNQVQPFRISDSNVAVIR